MEESILTSIKQLLGPTCDDTHFDHDIILHINSVFMILNQMGVGPKNAFKIIDDLAIWSDFISDENNLESVKSYIYLKVKLLFDPPSGSAVTETIKQMINELEWRLTVEAETKR